MERIQSFIAWAGLLLLASACQSPPTYEGHIKPIMNARCVQCHTDGGMAPFALTSYDLVKKWAPAVTVAVEDTVGGNEVGRATGAETAPVAGAAIVR